jgi:hypothetical protein
LIGRVPEPGAPHGCGLKSSRFAAIAAMLGSIAWQPASARNQAGADREAKAALIALLDHTADKYRESSRVCVDTTLRFFREATFPIIRNPGTTQRINWYSPEESADRSLSPELESQLTKAFSTRLAPPSTLRGIDLRWLKAPLVSSKAPECVAAAAAERGQRWVLRLSPPVRSGKFYFIELNRICTPMCGSGWVYTLSKKRGRWHVIAIKGSWIS